MIRTKQLSVLLVDDSPSLLRILTDFLNNYSQGEIDIVGTALDGREALAKAETLRPQVIVMDLAMPELPGLQAIPQLRRMLPEVGIVALTLFDSESYRQAALSAGANDFVSKARLETDLLPAIRRLEDRPRPWRRQAEGPRAGEEE